MFCECSLRKRSITTKARREPQEPPRETKMRKREREHVVGKIAKVSDSKHGAPLCVRPYKTDEKKLGQIARETGEGKGAIVRRMIRFALSDKQELFGSNRCGERLDWLIENERQSGKRSDGKDDRLDELLERLSKLETDNKLNAHKISLLVRELYMMSSVSLAAVNIILSRMIQLSSRNAEEKENSMEVADDIIAKLNAFAVRDLDKCCVFHGIHADRERASDLYHAARIKAPKEDAVAIPLPNPEPERP